MNKIFLGSIFIIMLVFTISSATATTSCTPRTGYDFCYTDGTLKIHGTYIRGWFYNNINYIDTSYNYPHKVYCEGGSQTHFFKDLKDLKCGSTCSGQVDTKTTTPAYFFIGDFTPLNNPTFVCHKSGSSWRYIYYYFGDKWDSRINECQTDGDCKVTQFCSKTNPYIVQCAELNCDSSQIIVDHKCVSPTIPELCQLAGINDIIGCQKYLSEFLDILQGDLDSKVKQISDLQISIEEKSILITKLTSDLEKQTEIVNKLTTNLNERIEYIKELTSNLEEQSLMISYLENTIAEKGIIIKNLQLNLEEQVYIINQLTSNLVEKSILINQLTVENEIQAELIKQMETSFSRQIDIIKNLNLTIQEDAGLIKKMNLTLDQQAELIRSLNLKIEEEIELVRLLNLKISEQEIIISKISKNLEDAKRYADELKLDNERLLKLIEEEERRMKMEKIIYGVVIGVLFIIILYMIWGRKKR